MKPVLYSLISALAVLLSPLHGEPGLGLSDALFGVGEPPAGAFPLVAGGQAAPLWLDPNDSAGVQRAAGDLQSDVERVAAVRPLLGTAGASAPPSARPVIIGTVGRSALIDSLIASGKLDAADLAGKWESFVITTVSQPMPGVEQALVIAGSDRRGTIYGIYEISEQLGVSPWYWWADVPVKPRSQAYVVPGRFASGEPVVKYRGIFLNDEAPALTGWAYAKFGGLNQQFYTKVFELLLRMRGNYLWPAMWGNAFNEDDPMNPALADQYGIVMGTSHHEPMLRAQQEWSRHKTNYGNAAWDYVTNPAGLQAFWADGVKRNKDYESVVTIGMRGDGDAPMIVGGNMASNVALLENIVADQRTIISQHLNPDPAKVPQLWALYKEVQDYYDYGMRVPDDVTLLYCDDNWGNIRRLPSGVERARSGGSGVYYHFDYVGGPRSYKWLNTNPLPKIQEQMNLANEYGANRIWIVNVGDLKPMEVPMEFFLRMAWNPARWPADKLGDYLHAWATREFGATYADEAASLVAAYTKFNGRRKPELLAPDTFSLLNHREAERIRQEWRALRTRAENLHALLPATSKDAFYQLVLHPVKASSIVNDLYVTAALNNLHVTQQRVSTNTLKAQAEALFQADADLVTFWNNSFAGGKWNHLMDQVHIGYTTWNSPAQNTIPALQPYAAPAVADLGVALEGTAAVLSAGGIGVLPALSSEGGAASRFIEVFQRGTLATAYSIEANQPWVNITNASGTVGTDVRAEVSLDWSRVPTGSGEVILTVLGTDSNAPRTVRLPFVKAAAASAALPVGFLDPDGYIAIEAPGYDRAVAAGGVGWKVSPDLGRSLGGVMPVPVTAASVTPGASSARLEYDVYLRRKGELDVRLIVSPSLNFVSGRGLRCAVSFDNQTPQLVDVGGNVDDASWSTSVKDSVRTVTTRMISEAVGPHVLKFWMVDPGVVLQRIEIDTGGLKTTCLGPPASPRGRRVAVPSGATAAAGSGVMIEAESGTLGAEFATTPGVVPAGISITTDNGGTSPGGAARVASYQVAFPAAGSYRLFARVRVGPAGANDDSLYIGNGFGTKSPTTSGNWKMINNLSGIGFTNLRDVVTPSANNGTAGAGVWKWLDLTTLSGTSFTVASGELTQTFQIGARENGLDIDKLVFGPSANTFTVDDLTQGNGGTIPGPSPFTLEAEAAALGSDFTVTPGAPSFVSISTNGGGSAPGSALRAARFQPVFPTAGSYRLFARVRVGPASSSDDSLFIGAGFGAKDPTLAGDWKTVNNLSGIGFNNASDAVIPSLSGSAGSGVWKWVDLSKMSGIGPFSVTASALTLTFDIGGREDGFDIDKLVFAPAANTYTVADLDTGGFGMAASSSPVVTVALADLRQVIDGFGASSAWTSSNITEEQADQFFSPASGLGLSLLRMRIAPDGTTIETRTAQKAVARGVKVWATPWSPPAAWKSNGDVNNGGTLLPEYQDDWAARLAGFAVTMQAAGVPLVAISAQNEPNYTAIWESCVWTPAELTAFIRDQLGPALVARGVSTRVLAAEPINWNSFASYADVLLADAGARSYLTHIGTHNYGGAPFEYPAVAAYGKAFWQTEYTDSAVSSDPTIDSALRVGNAIHDFLTVSQGNAWHYWWLLPNGSGTASTSALVEGGIMAKRGWAMGNWARFVRPGHHRVRTYGSLDSVRATAFIAPDNRRFTLVMVNSDSAARTVPLAIEGGAVPSLSPWETSAIRSLESLPPIPPAADGSFVLELPPRSVTSFVSTLGNDPAEYADWSAALPPSQRGADADPDGDGYSNLLTYAFGYAANESVPAANRPFLATAESGPLRFIFTLPADAPPDMRYQIERSDTLGSWTLLASKDGNGAWQGSVTPESETTPEGRTRFSLTAPIEGHSAFLRLRCTLVADPPLS